MRKLVDSEIFECKRNVVSRIQRGIFYSKRCARGQKRPFRSAEAETCVLNKQNQSKTMRSKFNKQVMNANNDNFV